MFRVWNEAVTGGNGWVGRAATGSVFPWGELGGHSELMGRGCEGSCVVFFTFINLTGPVFFHPVLM